MSSEHPFFDVTIQALSDPGRYEVSTGYRGVSNTAEIHWNLPETEIENYVLKSMGVRLVRRRLSGTDELVAAKDLGQRLFENILPDRLGRQYLDAAQKAIGASAPLRLRLNLDAAPTLVNVPWEFLYQDRLGIEFLSSSGRTQIVRHVGVAHQLPTEPLVAPIQVGVVVSQPQDFGLAELEVETEWRNLLEALDELITAGLVKVTRLPSVWPALVKRILYERQHVDILHFIGHGDFDRRTRTGVLVLEDSSGKRQDVGGDQVASILESAPPRLVFLNSCNGANTSTGDPFAGMAQSLLGRGVESVVAMQFEITDAAAKEFSRGLYRGISEGDALDVAVAEGRKLIQASGGLEWLTPVLYLQDESRPLMRSQSELRAEQERNTVAEHERLAVEEAEKKRKADQARWARAEQQAEAQRLAAEEAEKKRKADQARWAREAGEARAEKEAQRLVAEEAEKKRKADQARAEQQAEAVRLAAEQAEKKRKADQARAEQQAEADRLAAEQAEKKRKADQAKREWQEVDRQRPTTERAKQSHKPTSGWTLALRPIRWFLGIAVVLGGLVRLAGIVVDVAYSADLLIGGSDNADYDTWSEVGSAWASSGVLTAVWAFFGLTFWKLRLLPKSWSFGVTSANRTDGIDASG